MNSLRDLKVMEAVCIYGVMILVILNRISKLDYFPQSAIKGPNDDDCDAINVLPYPLCNRLA